MTDQKFGDKYEVVGELSRPPANKQTFIIEQGLLHLLETESKKALNNAIAVLLEKQDKSVQREFARFHLENIKRIIEIGERTKYLSEKDSSDYRRQYEALYRNHLKEEPPKTKQE